MQVIVQLTVNGTVRSVPVDSRMLLADMLRDELRLTGTHIGCATGNCGACTVVLSGRTVKSCCVLAADAEGEDVLTIEGLGSSPTDLHPIQDAFIRNQGLQCGYCTPGMVLSAKVLLEENADPTEDEIRHAISGNLCRCTGYHFIVDSILDAARELRGEVPPAGGSAADPQAAAAGHGTSA
jgi:carbon-monoxide dehydrogenase small subunit